MLTRLKPCPFCLGRAKRKHGKYNLLGAYGTPEQDRTWYAVYCTKCYISQPQKTYFTREDSDNNWNNRGGC